MLGYCYKYIANNWGIDGASADHFGSITIRMIINDLWDEKLRLQRVYQKFVVEAKTLEACTTKTHYAERTSPVHEFSRCGDCIYREASGRHETFHCSLYRAAGINHEPIQGLAPCRALTSETEQRFLLYGLRSKSDEVLRYIVDVDAQICWLRSKERDAYPRPPLPEHRPDGWFRAGSTIAWKKSVESKHFSPALITNIPERPSDGRQELRLQLNGEKDHYLVYSNDPRIMKFIELEFMQYHPEFAQTWAKTSRMIGSYGGPTLKQLTAAMRNGLGAEV